MRAAREQMGGAAPRPAASVPSPASDGAQTQRDGAPTPARPAGRWKALIVAGVAGVGLWLAVPRLIGSILLLPGHQALAILASGDALTEEGEARALHSRESASAWLADRRVYTDLAAIKLSIALKSGQMPETAQQLIDEAKADLNTGLALAPIDPRAWLQWANLRALQLATAQDADTGIRMSVRTGPAEREIYLERSAFALVLWQDLSAETRDLMVDQFRAALKASPRQFAALVHGLGMQDSIRTLFLASASAAEDGRRLDDALATYFAGS